MGLGLGLIQKVLYVATGGLSGLVFKDSSKKERKAVAEKGVRVQSRPKSARAKQPSARRPKRQAARSATADI